MLRDLVDKQKKIRYVIIEKHIQINIIEFIKKIKIAIL